MTQIDGLPDGDAEHMPAHWWSIQWVTSRIFYAVIGAIAGTRNLSSGDPLLYFASVAIVAVVFFIALTAIAWYYRRRWAREHS